MAHPPSGAQHQTPFDKSIASPAMSRKTVPIVHTQLWKDRHVDEKYTPARPSVAAAAEATSTRLSCGCRTNNAGLAAWCVLHSEQVHSEESASESTSSESTSSESPAGHGAREVPRIEAIAATAFRDDMLLHSELGIVCPLSQAFDCVSVTDSERDYLYRRLCEGLKGQHGASRQSQLSELRHHGQLDAADGDEREKEEKDRQFQTWVWQEFDKWVEFMHPDGSRSA
ncbi:hypothetical protein X797_006274 [Metarhizium robertsii]|uniref:Uncharacterized protein n=2 Tax=Metarhizium robertsii TaxID=568076 RepID=E9F587_METRA|nr:uncharacterized protein MAA_07436 [Metarhizium robertsii ARSEF 23]EFY97140.1 hypothetical protein MAA_07436 [Metarhizium robertsii ARSEF 23]EXV00558.1 hypothetical protein X797_006274 [Metarhizium robertsii]